MCGQKFDFIFLFQFIHSASEELKNEMNVIIITFIVIFWILLKSSLLLGGCIDFWVSYSNDFFLMVILYYIG